MKDILKKLMDGEISVDEAEKLLKINNIKQIEEIANFDLSRKYRSGFPEAVLAKGKTYSDLLLIILSYLEDEDDKNKLIVTKLENDVYKRMVGDVPNIEDFNSYYNEKGKVLILKKEEKKENFRYKIGLISAGTSDIPIAEEARIISQEGGCEVIKYYDIGIAGIHRLFPKIRKIIEEDVKVLIVCAGMEGALASIVAGLVDIPVIGVPTSVGYGIGANGEAAAYSMLQSCAPGLSVVNIDNGFGAAIFALTIVRLLENNRSNKLKI
ncbi:MAG: nickel pincer cofactor biosynthesis protein LarB [Methanobrevibacter sp.]|nr:nickel pincer cofactor biosynthesis protein LarB [Candidatus Methanovirga aequatorialis]